MFVFGEGAAKRTLAGVTFGVSSQDVSQGGLALWASELFGRCVKPARTFADDLCGGHLMALYLRRSHHLTHRQGEGKRKRW